MLAPAGVSSAGKSITAIQSGQVGEALCRFTYNMHLRDGIERTEQWNEQLMVGQERAGVCGHPTVSTLDRGSLAEVKGVL